MQTEYNFSKARFEKTGIWILKAKSEKWPVENASFGLKKRRELNSLRSRRLEVVGERENGRARGRHAKGEVSPRVSPSCARVFLCVSTTSKRPLRGLGVGKPGSTPPRKIPKYPPTSLFGKFQKLGCRR